jgi:hypothetical protein
MAQSPNNGGGRVSSQAFIQQRIQHVEQRQRPAAPRATRRTAATDRSSASIASMSRMRGGQGCPLIRCGERQYPTTQDRLKFLVLTGGGPPG